MKKLLICLSMLTAATVPQLSFAWGADGHQTVGAIADTLLTGTKAGAQVKNLLGDNTLEKCQCGRIALRVFRLKKILPIPQLVAIQNVHRLKRPTASLRWQIT